MDIKEIQSKIENVIDPSRGLTLKKLKAIKHIGIDEEKNCIILIIELGTVKTEAEAHVKREIAKIIKIDLGFNGVKFQFEENKSSSKIAGKDTKFIIISSSKGGVGKSTVTINLAYALKDLGKKVGIVDCDIYSSSIPKMMYVADTDITVDPMNKIIPAKKDEIELISTDFFSEKDSPLLWRGSNLTPMINNFLFQVAWSKDLDYILIDMPDGTGDTLLDLAQLLPDAKVLIVSEQDMLSATTVIKAAKAHIQFNQEIIGIVINKYTGNDYAELYYKAIIDKEVLVKIPYTKLEDDKYVYPTESEAYKQYKDLAMLISIR